MDSEIKKSQENWCKALVDIGSLFKKGQDYKSKAEYYIDELYSFDYDKVLFKPTKAVIKPIRTTKEDISSYFVGNGSCIEDKGFALEPWKKITFRDNNCISVDNIFLVMSNTVFTDYEDNSLQVQSTFGYVKQMKNPSLKIVLHHSSIPFKT